jgi:hypothetical protein
LNFGANAMNNFSAVNLNPKRVVLMTQ